MTFGRFFLLSLLLLAGFAYGVWRGHIDVPSQWNPWAPLDIRLAPNFLTTYKLRRLQDDRDLCEQALATSDLDYVAVPDSTPQAGCPVENAVRVRASAVRFNGAFLATCPLAAAYALFERHGLQSAAQAVFGQPVVRVDHFGSFACRNIARSNRRSQHASANALDLAGFHLADGTRITVARDWKGDDDSARFLRQVKAAACDAFRVTLSPEYNAAHHDHFHVDMGGFGMCR
ncbi:extensin-like domain-containing protein [Stutzerimonas nitrititolerans]|uniref:extensin-like domain-containing protein n=1 Tax=Stutzerimonas nitrititolerans TaxID=2482751 RepID=UPI0015E412EF|nr:extensin family protein [Stutzerimonas nitrititolerans]MBA1234590.1 extensin family protein [Stutzerimonas stutzeri]